MFLNHISFNWHGACCQGTGCQGYEMHIYIQQPLEMTHSCEIRAEYVHLVYKQISSREWYIWWRQTKGNMFTLTKTTRLGRFITGCQKFSALWDVSWMRYCLLRNRRGRNTETESWNQVKKRIIVQIIVCFHFIWTVRLVTSFLQFSHIHSGLASLSEQTYGVFNETGKERIDA